MSNRHALAFGTLLWLAIAWSASTRAQDGAQQGAPPAPASPTTIESAPVDGALLTSVRPPAALASQAAEAVPLPEQVAWSELRALQTTEQHRWRTLSRVHTGGPIAAITIGIPFMLTFVPWGALLLSETSSSSAQCYEEGECRVDRRVGGALLGIGLVGVTSVALGVWRVIVHRRRRSESESDLRAVAARRTSLERMLEWHYSGVR